MNRIHKSEFDHSIQPYFRCDIIAFAGSISNVAGESNLTSETSGLWQRLIRKSAKVDGGWTRSAL